MSFFDRAKEVTGGLLAGGRRQANRARLARERRRLESKLESEHAAIGQAVVPLLQAGTSSVDLPELASHVTAVGDLVVQIAATQAQIESLDDKGAAERQPSRQESIQNIDSNATAEAAADQSAKDSAAARKQDPAEEGGEG